MKNQVIITGTVLSIKKGRVETRVTIRTQRNSIINYPKVLFDGKMQTQLEKANLVEGDRLAIIGHIESFRMEYRGRYFYESKVVVDRFEVDKFGIKNTQDKNEFVIEGPLRSSFYNNDRNISILTYDMNIDNTKNSPQIFLFRKTDFNEGDNVFTKGSLQTKKVEDSDSGRTRYMQNFVATQVHPVE